MASSRSGQVGIGLNKTDKLRVLLAQGWSPKDAAEIAQTGARYARRIRDEMRAISAGMTLRQEVSRLRQDLSDLRRLTLSHIESTKPKLLETKPGKLRRIG